MLFRSPSIFMALEMLASGANSQNVYQAQATRGQPLVYRSEAGSYQGCGLRVVALVDAPTPNHILDYSMNLYRNENGWIGLSKLIFAKGKPGVKPAPQRRPVVSYKLAPQSGDFAVPLSDMQLSVDEPDALLASTTGEAALDTLTALVTGRPIQVALQLPNERHWRTYVTQPLLESAELETLLSCLESLHRR